MSICSSGFLWRGGQSALFLNGINEHLIYGQELLPIGPFTIAVTFCARSPGPGNSELVSQPGGVPFYLGRTWQNNLRAGDDWSDIPVAFPTDGKWHRMTLVSDVTSTVLYIDGREICRRETPIRTPPSLGEFRVGRQYGGYEEYFNGAIAEVVVWYGAQSPEQVRNYIGGTLLGREPGVATLLRFDTGELRERVRGAEPSVRQATCQPASMVDDLRRGAPLPGALCTAQRSFLFGNPPFLNDEGKPWSPEESAGILNPSPVQSFSYGAEWEGGGESTGWITGNVEFSVLKRQSGQVDFLVKLRCTGRCCYFEAGDIERTNYQDLLQVRANPSATSASQVMLLDSQALPQTNRSGAGYVSSLVWSPDGGFDVPGRSGERAYTASSHLSPAYDDFTTWQLRDLGPNGLTLRTNLGAYYGVNGVRRESGPDQLYDIVDGNMFVRWLRQPAELARTSLDQEYVFAYSSTSPSASGQVRIEIELQHRLVQASIQGRWGIPGAEVGGEPRITVYHYLGRIDCVADLDACTATIEKRAPVLIKKG